MAFKNDVYSAKFPRLDLNSGAFTTEIDVIGAGRKILRDGASVAVTRQSPSTLTITFGNVQIQCSFPFPVVESDTRVQVARKKGSLEVITPLVTSSNRGFFHNHPFRVVREQYEPQIQSPFLPCINFRKLRKLHISENAQLQAHLKSMFSDRENATKATTGEFDSLGCLKDAICGMLLSPTHIFRLRHVSSLFVFFVAGLYFDPNSYSIVADAYVKVLPPVPGIQQPVSALTPTLPMNDGLTNEK